MPTHARSCLFNSPLTQTLLLGSSAACARAESSPGALRERGAQRTINSRSRCAVGRRSTRLEGRALAVCFSFSPFYFFRIHRAALFTFSAPPIASQPAMRDACNWCNVNTQQPNDARKGVEMQSCMKRPLLSDRSTGCRQWEREKSRRSRLSDVTVHVAASGVQRHADILRVPVERGKGGRGGRQWERGEEAAGAMRERGEREGEAAAEKEE